LAKSFFGSILGAKEVGFMIEAIFNFVFGLIHDLMLASNRANDEFRNKQEEKPKTKNNKKRLPKKKTV
jgi:hypothetical protein